MRLLLREWKMTQVQFDFSGKMTKRQRAESVWLPAQREAVQRQGNNSGRMIEDTLAEVQNMGGGGYDGMRLRVNVQRRQRIIGRAIARRAGKIASSLN